MTCLVIGGGGFIGQWVTRCVADSGRDVRVMGRSPTRPADLDPRAQYCAGDYGNTGFLRDHLAGVDEIVDLAYSTVPKSSFEDPIFDIQSNLAQAVNMFQAARELPAVRKVVVVSSGGTVYGHSTSPLITEAHATNPVSPYGITKLAVEKYALMFHQLFGLPAVVARPANAYGEGQIPYRGQGFVATAVASILDGKPLTVFGGDRVTRDYIHVADVADGIVAVLESGRPGRCYNIGTGAGRTTNQVLDVLASLADAEGISVNVIHQDVRPFDVMTNVLDSTLLAVDAGWKSRLSVEVGLSRYWRSVRSRSPSGRAAGTGASRL